MAKKDAVQARENDLLNFFVEKEPDFVAPRDYPCPIFNKTFYFLHASMAIDKYAHNQKVFKGAFTQTRAKYWSLACDAKGRRFCPEPQDVFKAVNDTALSRSFRNHCIDAMKAMGEVGDDPDSGKQEDNPFGDTTGEPNDSATVDAEIEGTLDNEKKPFSNQSPEGT